MACAEDWGYIRPATDGGSPVHTQPVTGSLLFGSPLRRVLGRWVHALMCGCGDNECSPGEIGCGKIWGYIRPATDGGSPVHTQPVTGSLLFGSPLRRILGRWLHVLMRGCRDNECSPGKIGCGKNWGYIRPATDVSRPDVDYTC